MARPRRHRHPAALIAAGTVLLIAADMVLWVLWAAWHVMPWLIAAAVIILACRRWQLHRRAWASLTRPRPLPQGHVITAELAELAEVRAERDQLRTDLAAAEAARDAAWDAAASAPPRFPASRDEAQPLTRLLSHPLSGARPISTRR